MHEDWVEQTAFWGDPAKPAVLFANTARVLGDAPLDVKLRHIRNCLKADPAYGQGVADALGLAVPELAGAPTPA